MELNVKALSQTRVLPSLPRNIPVSVPLSIINATVANFAPSETILLYDAKISATTLTPEHLRRALEKTLDAYPQWCGRLHRTPYLPANESHTHRFGRLMLTYGDPEDPGVIFVVAEADRKLSDLVPNGEQRANAARTWDASGFPSAQLVPQTALSTLDLDDPSLPSFVIQVTTFCCGGMAVALKLAHPLTDAHAMSFFARDWAAASCAIAAKSPVPQMNPVFDPQMLDRCAAGDIDAPCPDPQLVTKAQSLPCHQYDWWISEEGCPFPTKSTEIPNELKEAQHGLPGQRMPWSEWDIGASVSHYVLHFTGLELERLWQAASTPSAPVSRQDALLAHIWACVNRSRALEDDDNLVYIDYTLGLRSRTAPKLPQRFVGSPLMIAAIPTTGREACADSPAKLASLIRSTVTQFTSENVAAYLHAKVHEQSPQRIWQAFLGRRHLLVTSWIHTHLYDVDFGTGKPRYVEAVMPKTDGLLQLMEAAPLGKSLDPRHWADDGVDVQLHLTTETMLKLLKDPLLRKYSA